MITNNSLEREYQRHCETGLVRAVGCLKVDVSMSVWVVCRCELLTQAVLAAITPTPHSSIPSSLAASRWVVVQVTCV